MILHLVSSFRWTGAAEPAAILAAAQQALGRETAVALQPGGAFQKRAAAMGLAVEARVLRRRAGPLALWRGARAIRGLARSSDAVYAHLTADHWLAGLALASSRKRPGPRALLIREFHREEIPRRDPASRWLANATDGAIAISSSLAKRLEERLGFGPERLLVAGGSVDAEAFSPGGDGARLREAWGVPPEAPLAGLLCRVRESRGVFDLLAAAEPLLRRVPEAHLVFCGRGRHAERLAQAIAEHPRRERIHFPGYVKPEQLRDAYAAFDVAVQLAPGNDGACRAALEAMACERPLVAARVGALADLLSRPDGGGGFLDAPEGGLPVPPGDPEALAEALAAYMADATLRRCAGWAARKLIVERHRPEDRARKILEFQDALADRLRSAGA